MLCPNSIHAKGSAEGVKPCFQVAGWRHNDFKIFQTFNVCTIFFVSGMTLKTEDVKDALKGTLLHPYAIALTGDGLCLGG